MEIKRENLLADLAQAQAQAAGNQAIVGYIQGLLNFLDKTDEPPSPTEIN